MIDEERLQNLEIMFLKLKRIVELDESIQSLRFKCLNKQLHGLRQPALRQKLQAKIIERRKIEWNFRKEAIKLERSLI